MKGWCIRALRVFLYAVGAVTGGLAVAFGIGLLLAAPAQAATVQIRHRDGQVTVTADELGRFMSSAVPAGPVSLRLTTEGGPPRPAVITDWVAI